VHHHSQCDDQKRAPVALMGVRKDFGQHQRRIDAHMEYASCLGTIVFLVPCQTRQTLFGVKGKSDMSLLNKQFYDASRKNR